jgi:hypothetical protein
VKSQRTAIDVPLHVLIMKGNVGRRRKFVNTP